MEIITHLYVKEETESEERDRQYQHSFYSFAFFAPLKVHNLKKVYRVYAQHFKYTIIQIYCDYIFWMKKGHIRQF